MISRLLIEIVFFNSLVSVHSMKTDESSEALDLLSEVETDWHYDISSKFTLMKCVDASNYFNEHLLLTW